MAEMGFFEMREKLLAPQAKAPPAAKRSASPSAPAADKPLTVWQLTQIIEKAIKAGVPAEVHVRAEASNFKLHAGSGHAYFTLKDARACIDCVMFRDDVARLKFRPEDGMELLAGGRVAVYPARGRYQLYATALEPVGHGALELAFRQLCAKLEKEGLFAPERKKPLPAYPMRIALVSGADTAAMHDMLKVLRRFPWVKLLVCPVPVQGDGAAEEIARVLRQLNSASFRAAGELARRSSGASENHGEQARRLHEPREKGSEIDLILLARGGGSLEDLWAFNVECVARAIVASRIPIVTGIGHEIDVSIADLAADYHAHTPTEAAQVAVAQWRGVRELLETSGARLRRSMRAILHDVRQRLISIERHDFFRRPIARIQQMQQMIDDRQKTLILSVMQRIQDIKLHVAGQESRLRQRHPRHVMRLMRQRLDFLAQRLDTDVRQNLSRRALALDGIEKRLEAVAPQQVLRRGYSMTFAKRDGKLIRSAEAIKPGDRLLTRLADGQIESTVEDARQLRLFD